MIESLQLNKDSIELARMGVYGVAALMFLWCLVLASLSMRKDAEPAKTKVVYFMTSMSVVLIVVGVAGEYVLRPPYHAPDPFKTVTIHLQRMPDEIANLYPYPQIRNVSTEDTFSELSRRDMLVGNGNVLLLEMDKIYKTFEKMSSTISNLLEYQKCEQNLPSKGGV